MDQQLKNVSMLPFSRPFLLKSQQGRSQNFNTDKASFASAEGMSLPIKKLEIPRWGGQAPPKISKK